MNFMSLGATTSCNSFFSNELIYFNITNFMDNQSIQNFNQLNQNVRIIALRMLFGNKSKQEISHRFIVFWSTMSIIPLKEEALDLIRIANTVNMSANILMCKNIILARSIQKQIDPLIYLAHFSLQLFHVNFEGSLILLQNLSNDLIENIPKGKVIPLIEMMLNIPRAIAKNTSNEYGRDLSIFEMRFLEIVKSFNFSAHTNEILHLINDHLQKNDELMKFRVVNLLFALTSSIDLNRILNSLRLLLIQNISPNILRTLIKHLKEIKFQLFGNDFIMKEYAHFILSFLKSNERSINY